MTCIATINAGSLNALINAARAIQEANNLIGQATFNDADQLDLFEPGADQACESFMEERAELRQQLSDLRTFAHARQRETSIAREQLRQELESHRVYTQGLRSQIDSLGQELIEVSNAYHRAQEDRDIAIDSANGQAETIRTNNVVLRHIDGYANQLQDRLNSIGISHQADDETGEPRLSVNLRVLDEAVRDMIDRS
jgi:chromosome segregation ATPase